MIAGVILAAGSSRRLGRPKQLLELDGKPLLQHVVDAAADAGLGELVIVLGHEAKAIEAALELPAFARCVLNPDHEQGQSTSVRHGLSSVQRDAEAAALILGDQPRMTAALIDLVIAAFRAGHKPVARPFYRGLPGHPVVVDRAAFGIFSDISGDSGGRSILSAAVDVEIVNIDQDPPADVDTWEQYEALGGG